MNTKVPGDDFEEKVKAQMALWDELGFKDVPYYTREVAELYVKMDMGIETEADRALARISVANKRKEINKRAAKQEQRVIKTAKRVAGDFGKAFKEFGDSISMGKSARERTDLEVLSDEYSLSHALAIQTYENRLRESASQIPSIEEMMEFAQSNLALSEEDQEISDRYFHDIAISRSPLLEQVVEKRRRASKAGEAAGAAWASQCIEAQECLPVGISLPAPDESREQQLLIASAYRVGFLTGVLYCTPVTHKEEKQNDRVEY